MDRRTEIPYIDLRLLDDGWRVIFHFESKAGNWENNTDEIFRTEFVFPLGDRKMTLDEAKMKAFDYFKSVLKDVAAILEKASFDSLLKEKE